MVDLLRLNNICQDKEKLFEAIKIFEPHFKYLTFSHITTFLPSLRWWTQEDREKVIAQLVEEGLIIDNNGCLSIK